MRGEVYKTSVNLSAETVKALEQLSKARGKSMAQIIREAIATEKFLHDTVAAGKKVLIEDTDKSLRELLIR